MASRPTPADREFVVIARLLRVRSRMGVQRAPPPPRTARAAYVQARRRPRVRRRRLARPQPRWRRAVPHLAGRLRVGARRARARRRRLRARVARPRGRPGRLVAARQRRLGLCLAVQPDRRRYWAVRSATGRMRRADAQRVARHRTGDRRPARGRDRRPQIDSATCLRVRRLYHTQHRDGNAMRGYFLAETRKTGFAARGRRPCLDDYSMVRLYTADR